MNRYMNSIRTALLAVLFLAGGILRGDDGIDRAAMERDLAIARDVLGHFLTGQSAGDFTLRTGIRSAYLPGYGVILTSDDPLRQGVVFSVDEDAIVLPGGDARRAAPEIAGKGERLVPAARLDSLRATLTAYLGTYGGAIGQLRDTDRITVIVNLNPPMVLFRGRGNNAEPPMPERLSVSVTREQVDRYRRGRIDDAAFRNALVFTQDPPGDVSAPIDILAGIFDRALESGPGNWRVFGETEGTYIAGLGAVIWVPTPRAAGFAPAAVELRAAEEALARVRESFPDAAAPRAPRSDRSERAAAADSLRRHLRTTVAEFIGQYGHTLRLPADSDRLLVVVGGGRRFGGSEAAFHLIVPAETLRRLRQGPMSAADILAASTVWPEE